MLTNEKQFLDYFYTNYIVNKITNVNTINEAYKILYGKYPSDNCSTCVKSRLEQLKIKYVVFSKIQTPELIIEKKLKTRYDTKTITGYPSTEQE